MQAGVRPDLSEMSQKKISISMKRAMVLNKGETGELKRKVGYLRKSRDEALMELKAERLRLRVKKIHDSHDESSKKEEGSSEEELKVIRKLSVTDKKFVQNERPKSLFPPLTRGASVSNFRSASEPSTPTNALEFRSHGHSDLQDTESIYNQRSVRLRKVEQDISRSYGGSQTEKGKLNRSHFQSGLSDCRLVGSDSKLLNNDIGNGRTGGKLEHDVIAGHGRKISRANFEDKLTMLKMAKEPFNNERHVDKKNIYGVESTFVNGVTNRKYGLPHLMDINGHPEYGRKYDGYKTV